MSRYHLAPPAGRIEPDKIIALGPALADPPDHEPFELVRPSRDQMSAWLFTPLKGER